jgi:hypothetical protein
MRLSIIPYLSFILILLFLICETPAFYGPDTHPSGVPVIIIDHGIVPGIASDTTKVVCVAFYRADDYWYLKFKNSDKFLPCDRYSISFDYIRYLEILKEGEGK